MSGEAPYWIDHDGVSGLAWAVAQRLAQALRLGLQRNGRASLVLGTGPLVDEVVRRLATNVLDWRRVTICLADEPWVPPGDDANAAHRLAHLLAAGDARHAALVPLVRGAGSAGDDARAAAFDLARLPRPFDAVVVTVGPDGRIGGLVPGSHGLDQLLAPTTPPTVAALDVAGADLPHLTLTLTALADAHMVLVLGQGQGARTAVEDALAGAGLPVARLVEQAAVPLELHLCP